MSGPTTESTNVDVILKGIDLSKYSELFHKKRIEFDHFLLLDESDLIKMKINDEADRKSLISAINTLRPLFKETAPPRIAGHEMIGNVVHQMRTILGLMIVLRRVLKSNQYCKNTLVDTQNSSANAIQVISKRTLFVLYNIQKDLKDILKVKEAVKTPKNESTYVAHICCVGLATVAVGYLISTLLNRD